eukprot:CAMPEP_0179133116 /NCGR_PEP_ID=MMETSP0796-20121207/63292_1 /TAXON_ID=73915 /ORGANISM="Pyrodinium bahamense, Strain pbaha01" /LENGTH=194 /DNA_ID=CAMNT_0020832073 /DNA_START=80 /DNA_END=660 /DNA_ORIENTATION=+
MCRNEFLLAVLVALASPLAAAELAQTAGQQVTEALAVDDQCVGADGQTGADSRRFGSSHPAPFANSAPPAAHPCPAAAMCRNVFLLAAWVALASPLAAAELAQTAAEVTEALGVDDQCVGADGQTGAECALNALQRRGLQGNGTVLPDSLAVLLKVSASDLHESGGSCDTGIVGQIKLLAPTCLDACPQACGPL